MIQAMFHDNGKQISVIIQGHGGGQKGTDLICAGASTLFYTLAQIAEVMWADGKLLEEPTIQPEDGYGAVILRPKPDYYDEALYAAYFCEVGMLLLQRDYPNAVSVLPFGFCASEANASEHMQDSSTHGQITDSPTYGQEETHG